MCASLAQCIDHAAWGEVRASWRYTRTLDRFYDTRRLPKPAIFFNERCMAARREEAIYERSVFMCFLV